MRSAGGADYDGPDSGDRRPRRADDGARHRRAGRHVGGARAACRARSSARRGGGRHGARRASRRGHGSDEDGARDRRATAAGIVREIAVAAGDTIFEGHPAAVHRAGRGRGRRVRGRRGASTSTQSGPTCGEVRDRHALTLDDAGPTRSPGGASPGSAPARENIADLCDPGTFIEYGALTVARAALSRHRWRSCWEHARRTAW